MYNYTRIATEILIFVVVYGCIYLTVPSGEQGVNPNWTYSGGTGPQYWSTMAGNSLCAGAMQSPINFPKNTEMTYDSNLAPFTFTDFHDTSKYTLTMKNDGHTVKVSVNGDVYVNGGGLGEQYKTAQFHFHWGGDSAVGSEHVYNGKSYPIELHIVNYNYVKYGSLGNAADKSDGLAVLGYFFEVSNENNADFEPITNLLSNIRYKGNETDITNFPLTKLLGATHENYYRYQGSLTTPGCFESVKWTVFYETLKISESQLAEFRSLFFTDGNPMVNNYRPPLAIGSRTIYRSFELAQKWSYVGNTGPSYWQAGYPECVKTQQSPIDLPPWMEMTYSADLEPFTFENFDDPSKYNLTLKNNGHTAQVDVDGEVYVSGGNIGGKYKTAQFHFHWGGNDMRGSEHTYNGQTFPMELHIVNFNYEKYPTLGEAADKPDGLAVLGYFFEVSPIHNCHFSPVLTHFSNIMKKGNSTSISNFKLSNILGKSPGKYYRYQGSLTTPPCFQSVTWTVFFEKLPISVEQLATMRSLFEDKYGSIMMLDNWRPPMPRNDRVVYISFSVDPVGGAPEVLGNVFIICLSLLFSRYS